MAATRPGDVAFFVSALFIKLMDFRIQDCLKRRGLRTHIEDLKKRAKLARKLSQTKTRKLFEPPHATSQIPYIIAVIGINDPRFRFKIKRMVETCGKPSTRTVSLAKFCRLTVARARLTRTKPSNTDTLPTLSDPLEVM